MEQSRGRRPGIRLTEQQLRSRKARSLAIGLALGAFALIFYVITIAKLGPAAFQGTMG